MKAQPNQWPLVVEGALQGHVLLQARREARHMKEQGTTHKQRIEIGGLKRW
jgi:hypothetical protein